MRALFDSTSSSGNIPPVREPTAADSAALYNKQLRKQRLALMDEEARRRFGPRAVWRRPVRARAAIRRPTRTRARAPTTAATARRRGRPRRAAAGRRAG